MNEKSSIEALSKAARVLIQARMLPMTKLTDDQISQIRSDYQGYTSRLNLFDSYVAKQIGCAPSVLSQWKQGRYPGDTEAVARKLNDWMERDARQRKASLNLDYVKTTVAENMRSIATMASTTSSMAVIVIPSGCGKTMMLQILTEKLSGQYLYCDELLTPRSFLRALSEALDVRQRRGGAAAGIMRDIIDKLRGTNRPLFLDEAHRLPSAVFSVIRSIHDQAEVPIIMAGTEEIVVKVDDRSNNRGQMTSRCLRYNAMDHCIDGENPDPKRKGKPLYTKKEIEALFASSNVRFDPEAFQMLHAMACIPGFGCIRTVRRLVQLIREAHPDAEISRDLIIWALGLLFGQLGNHMVTKAEQMSEQLNRRTA